MRRLLHLAERVGRATAKGVDELGFGAALFGESLFWLFMGPRRRQPVRVGPIFAQAMEIGIHALPIITVLAVTIGVMLAIQGIYSLRAFGAEQQVVLGIALSLVREFAPLITGILVAGVPARPSPPAWAPCASTRRSMPCASWASARSGFSSCRHCWRWW